MTRRHYHRVWGRFQRVTVVPGRHKRSPASIRSLRTFSTRSKLYRRCRNRRRSRSTAGAPRAPWDPAGIGSVSCCRYRSAPHGSAIVRIPPPTSAPWHTIGPIKGPRLSTPVCAAYIHTPIGFIPNGNRSQHTSRRHDEDVPPKATGSESFLYSSTSSLTPAWYS